MYIYIYICIHTYTYMCKGWMIRLSFKGRAHKVFPFNGWIMRFPAMSG